jgi:hypothetical protein
MKHLAARNRKSEAMMEWLEAEQGDVAALQDSRPPHYPPGCTTVFSPGWEVDTAGGTAGLCQPVERDLYDCYKTCYWPAQVPDYLNNNPDWHSACASATRDWRKIDLVFP